MKLFFICVGELSYNKGNMILNVKDVNPYAGFIKDLGYDGI